MNIEDKITEIREEIRKLQTQREIAILEKGLSARYNNDLRENASYDYWVEQEYYCSFKIQSLLKAIADIKAQNNKKSAKVRKTVKSEKIKDDTLIKKQRWL